MAETIPMGIGELGFKNLIFKRKFRFTFEIDDICDSQKVPSDFVKVAARPSLSIEEVELNHLNAKTWIAGKASWEAITITYYDVASSKMAPLYSWLATVYDFTDPINLKMGSHRGDYAGTGILKMWDGCGNLIEIWTLRNVWPTSINFNDVDYAVSDECTIELSIRYSDVTYEPICPQFEIEPCCTPCDEIRRSNG